VQAQRSLNKASIENKHIENKSSLVDVCHRRRRPPSPASSAPLIGSHSRPRSHPSRVQRDEPAMSAPPAEGGGAALGGGQGLAGAPANEGSSSSGSSAPRAAGPSRSSAPLASAALAVARSLAAAPAPGAALALLASFIHDLNPASSANVR